MAWLEETEILCWNKIFSSQHLSLSVKTILYLYFTGGQACCSVREYILHFHTIRLGGVPGGTYTRGLKLLFSIPISMCLLNQEVEDQRWQKLRLGKFQWVESDIPKRQVLKQPFRGLISCRNSGSRELPESPVEAVDNTVGTAQPHYTSFLLMVFPLPLNNSAWLPLGGALGFTRISFIQI